MPVAGSEQVPADEVKVVEQEGEDRNMAQEEEQEKEESEVEDKMIMTQQEGEEEASNVD